MAHPNTESNYEKMSQENATFKDHLLSLRDRQLQAFFEGAIDAMVITDDAGCHLDVNPAACQLFGTCREDLLGREIDAFCEPNFRFSQIWQGVEQEERVTGEFRLLRPDGIVYEVEYVTTINFLPHRHLSVIRNLSQRKQMERELERLKIELEQRTAECTIALYQAHQQRAEESVQKSEALASLGDRGSTTEALRQSEQKFRGAFDTIPTGMALISLAGAFLEANQSLCQMLGYAETEILSLGLQDIIDPDDQRSDVELVERLFKDELTGYQLEKRFVHKQGHSIWGLYSVALIRDHQKHPLYLIAHILDISDRKRHEQSLRDNQALLSAIIEGTQDLIAALDLNFRFIAFNTAYQNEFRKIFGQDIQIGTSLVEALAALPEEQENSLKLWNRALAGEEFTVVQEFGDANRERNCYEMTYSTIRGRDGQRLGASHLVRDVTERRQADRLLRESEERYRSVVTAMAEGVVLQQADGAITAWNRSAEQILGLAPKQILGRTSVDLDWRTIHEDGSHFPADEHPSMVTLRTGQPQTGIVMGIQKGNQEITWISINSQPLFHLGETQPYAVVASFADFTRQKQAEDSLRSQLQKEQALSYVIQTIHRSLDLSVIFSTTAEAIGEFYQVDRVKIVQYYPHHHLWRIVAEHRRTQDLAKTLGNEIWDEENQTIAQLKHFQVVHTNGSIWMNQQPGEETDPGMRMAVPLRIRGQLWGALSLMKHQASSPWKESETEFLLTVATQLAIAIQQSELHQQVQTLNTHLEQQVEVRTAELQSALYREMVLKRITDTMRNSLDEAAILQTVVHQLGTALKVICCDAVLYNEDRTSLTISYDYTQGYPSAQGTTLDLSLYGAELNPLLQEQPLQFCLLQPIPGSPYPELYQSTMIACPIRDAEDILGELWLFTSSGQVFDLRDIRLVEQVADQCAIALRQSRLYQASQAYAKELERLNQLKDDFLSTVTHELRAPMANIKMATQMLELTLQPLNILDAKSMQYLEILKQECDRETSLINDLLDLSRLEAGQMQLTLVTLDLQLWLPQVIAPFVERTRNQGQELEVSLATDLPRFETDVSYLQRVVTELLHNACKYTPPGERIILAVEWLAAPADTQNDGPCAKDHLQIRVTNTGIEISEYERDRIFDKFYRIPNNDPWKHGGTGLGLALIKKLTECLGGTICLESSSGETSFTLKFFPG